MKKWDKSRTGNSEKSRTKVGNIEENQQKTRTKSVNSDNSSMKFGVKLPHPNQGGPPPGDSFRL